MKWSVIVTCFTLFSPLPFPLPTSTPPPPLPHPAPLLLYHMYMYLNLDSTCGRKHLWHTWQSSLSMMVPTPTYFHVSDVTAVFTTG